MGKPISAYNLAICLHYLPAFYKIAYITPTDKKVAWSVSVLGWSVARLSRWGGWVAWYGVRRWRCIRAAVGGSWWVCPVRLYKAIFKDFYF